jgi:hypothetical protein
MKDTSSRQSAIVSAVALAGLFLMSPLVCAAQKVGDQIGAENANLRKLLTNSMQPPERTNEFLTQLKLIDEASQSGNLLQAMYHLQRVRIELMAQGYVKSKSEVEKGGAAAFELEWKRLGRELTAREKQLVIRGNTRLPAAVRALAESSLTQVQPYYQSGLLYGRNTTIGDGLYYLGLALANLDFARFCQQLKFERPKPAPKLRSIQTPLESLEAAAIKAFQDPSNTTKQRRFIEINSTLKMACELQAERRYAGALKTYLYALLAFGTVNVAVPNAETTTRLRKQAEELRARLTAAASDQTIGLIYLELALTAKSEAELKRAAVIVEQVVPGYLDAQGEAIK